MKQYYIRSRGRVQGPFTKERLHALSRRGMFGPHFHVSFDGQTWSSASEHPELFHVGNNMDRIETPIEDEHDKVIWHVVVRGNRQGPVSLNQLKQLVAVEQIGPSDLVWKEGMVDWIESINVSGLFPGGFAPRTSVEAVASLIFSLTGASIAPVFGSIVGVIFGHVALSRIRAGRGRYKGRALAFGGLAIGYLVLVIGIITLVVAIMLYVRQPAADV